MSYTLFDATLDLAREVTDVVEGTATGGSADSLSDSNFPNKIDGSLAPEDDHYNNGTIWIKSGNNIGETAVITDWDQSSMLFTFNTMGLLNAAGNLYAACASDFPRYLLRQSVNTAMRHIGDVDQQDTSLTTVADQAEYTLPAGVHNVRMLEKAARTATPYDYREIPRGYWEEIENQIQWVRGFQPQDTGYILRLTYNGPWTDITADSDTLPNDVAPEYVLWEAAVHALRWRLQAMKNDGNEVVIKLLNEALQNAVNRTREYRPLMRKRPRDHAVSAWATRIRRP